MPIRVILIFCFLFSFITQPIAVQAQLDLPRPGQRVCLTPPFNPALLKGIKIYPNNPFHFEFILDRGQENTGGTALKEESRRLINYFFSSMTIAEKDMWVNLSPYEKDRIIPEVFGQTQMGRDVLAQDYILKQVTASLIYPEEQLGKEFWNKVYEEARKKFGTTNVPVNTFNKVWIVPDKASFYAKNNVVYIVDAKLKVMLEEDYLALKNNHERNTSSASIGSAVVREIVIPQLNKEVNEGKNFAQLRQVYNSLVLAAWYKKKIKDSILRQVYAGSKGIRGLNISNAQATERIYQRYLQAFKKGVYNYIKEEQDPLTHQVLPRKYFSGGVTFGGYLEPAMTAVSTPGSIPSKAMAVDVNLRPVDAAMDSGEGLSPDEVSEWTPEQIAKRFRISILDANYYKGLLEHLVNEDPTPEIAENSIPTAYLDDKTQQEIVGVYDGDAIYNDPKNWKAAKEARINMFELKGGMGTSLVPRRMKELTGEVMPGDKSTNFFKEGVPVPGWDRRGNPTPPHLMPISIGEMKLRRYIYLIKKHFFKHITVEEAVHSISEKAVRGLWNQEYLDTRFDERPGTKHKTYEELFNSTSGLGLAPNFVTQSLLPVLTRTGRITDQFISPGGHARHAFFILNRNLTSHIDRNSPPEITEFASAEGVNTMLAPPVAGFMINEHIPIVMVTTDRRLPDNKGGIIVLMRTRGLPRSIRSKLDNNEPLTYQEVHRIGNLYPNLYEIAYAKTKEQKNLFRKMGLRLGSHRQLFYTNLNAQYHNDLDPFLQDLEREIGIKRFYKAITPDLILNPDKFGNDRMEGASGSSILALNRFCMQDPDAQRVMRRHHIRRLVAFVNFGPKFRPKTYSEGKFSADYFTEFSSDLYHYNYESSELELTREQGKEFLPGINLTNPFYNDSQNLIEAFGEHPSFKGLDYMGVTGVIRFPPNSIYKGVIIGSDKTGHGVVTLQDVEHVLNFRDGRPVFDNVAVNIDASGKVNIKPLPDPQKAMDAFEDANYAMTSDDVEDAPETHRITKKGSTVGGIDLNTSNLKMETRGENSTIVIDAAMVRELIRGDSSGLFIEIRKIEPVNVAEWMGNSV